MANLYNQLDSEILKKENLDELSDAFRVGRVLREDAATIEYNIKARDAERKNELSCLEIQRK